MEDISHSEKMHEQYEGFRREDEASGSWLQRILHEPLQRFDVKNVRGQFDTMEEQRTRSQNELQQEVHAACLELEAWAASRPPAEHQLAFNGIESKIRAVHDESEKQERLCVYLIQFAEMLSGALSLLSSASQIFSADTEGNVIASADSVSRLPPSSPPHPKVLAPDSDVDIA